MNTFMSCDLLVQRYSVQRYDSKSRLLVDAVE